MEKKYYYEYDDESSERSDGPTWIIYERNDREANVSFTSSNAIARAYEESDAMKIVEALNRVFAIA